MLRWDISNISSFLSNYNAGTSKGANMLVDISGNSTNHEHSKTSIESFNLSFDTFCSSNGVVGNSIDIDGMTGSMVVAYDDGCLICCDDVEIL